MYSYIFAAIIGYFFGSIPSGYIAVKAQSGRDLRAEGSGNVGARNAFDVTGSKNLGVAVMIADAVKGALAVVVTMLVVSPDVGVISCAGLFSIAGHNYSVWLRGKGGRGLATGAGALLILGWYVVVVWLLLWAAVNAVRKNVHIANAAALVLTPVVVACIPATVRASITPAIAQNVRIVEVSSIIALLCLARHIEPLRELWKSQSELN